MKYIAHIREEDNSEQPLIDHLKGTAVKASSFAEKFDASELAMRCGLLHDIGKYSDAFQRRIRGSGEKVDHSTAGAQVEFHKMRDVASSFCIAGHHGGLNDLGGKADLPQDSTLLAKLKRRSGIDIEDYSEYEKELVVPKYDYKNPKWLSNNQELMFFTRMLYSCLVDADFLDTEHFMSNAEVVRGGQDSLEELSAKLDSYIAPWWDAKTSINQKRSEILKSLLINGERDKGLFTLSVPTGGGKTVSSVAFALRHALKKENKIDRIIYVIPYTSIIEQTQTVFEEIFGDKNVIAHFADVVYPDGENRAESDKRKLASENWDAPIILTTTVQFFESLYSNKSSRCRKLHNIVNSIIIFDEAQMMPVPYLKPCIYVISELIRHYSCSAVLCTATQPSLNRLFEEILPEYQPRELCSNVPELYEFFTRVTYKMIGKISDEGLADRLKDEEQVLCILNSRKQAQRITDLVGGENTYHLSTTMFPEHRRRVLTQIRKLLKEGKKCRVISTSLVEAGVDVDFPIVYRAIAGLDSIIQAGGRCNRESKRQAGESIVYVFDTDEPSPQMIMQNIAATREILRDYEDFTSPQAVKAYFELLYYILKGEESLDTKKIMKEIESGTMAFEKINNMFRIIENSQFIVYIPVGEGKDLVEQLKSTGLNRAIMRQLSHYSVGVYPNHFSELLETGGISPISDNAAVLINLELYSDSKGLSLSIEEGRGLIV